VDLTRGVDLSCRRSIRAATSWGIDSVEFDSPRGVWGGEWKVVEVDLNGSGARGDGSVWDRIDPTSDSLERQFAVSTSMSISSNSAEGGREEVGKPSS
jgi:hypothetical protein